MKFVAVDTYDIVNVGLRSQMVWKGLIDKLMIGEEAALKCFTACEQLAVECAIFHFLIEWIKEQSNANFIVPMNFMKPAGCNMMKCLTPYPPIIISIIIIIMHPTDDWHVNM